MARATGLVRYGVKNPSEVLEVREFEVAQALLRGEKQLLSEELETQWGWCHLFDLLLCFNHVDTAWRLAEAGVEGCFLEERHLGDAVAEPCAVNALGVPLWVPRDHFACEACRGERKTCCACCWGFAVEGDHWMKDWWLSPGKAAEAAQEVAERPLLHRILAHCRVGLDLPCQASPEAMARILDVAILTGEQAAAKHLAAHSLARPLRRWTFHQIFQMNETYQWQLNGTWKEPLLAALAAGARLQDSSCYLLQAIVFSGHWHDFVGLMDERPSKSIGAYLFGRQEAPFGAERSWRLCLEILRDAWDAGFMLQNERLECYTWERQSLRSELSLTLLDIAILQGQAECAEFCVAADVGVKACSKLATTDEIFLEGFDFRVELVKATLEDRRRAANCAVQMAYRRCFRLEVQAKGVAMWQISMAFGCPAMVVDEILAFAMETPSLVRDLQGFLGDLHSSAWQVPRPREVLQATPCSEGPAEVDQEPQVDEKATEDLMHAMRESRHQAPALNSDGVCLYRLTRNSKAHDFTELLQDVEGPFRPLHLRVLQAGCEVQPSWSPVRALFVPCTEEQMEELQGLAAHGYELCREQHLLALRGDEELISEALRCLVKRHRPKIKLARPQGPARSSEVEVEALLVLETNLRTNSSLGYPSRP